MLTAIDKDTATEHYVPLAALRRDLRKLSAEHKFGLVDGSDDLDNYTCAYLRTGTGDKFVLIRYRGIPDDQVEVFVPARLPKPKAVMARILRELNVSPSDVVSTNEHYEDMT
jgi:hypothetical protein